MRLVHNVGLLLVLLVVSGGMAAEPNNVGEIFKEKGFEWFFGNWTGVNDKSEQVQGNLKLVLNGHAVSLKARVAQYEYMGAMYYVKNDKTIVNTGVDNLGNIFSGTWKIEGDKLILKLIQTSLDGKVDKFKRYHSKIDADTMKLETYRILDGDGTKELIADLEMKRKK